MQTSAALAERLTTGLVAIKSGSIHSCRSSVQFSRAVTAHNYASIGATPADVLLIVEVADSSEAYDRRTKAPLHGRNGIPELWIVDLNRDRITRYLDPAPDGYATTQVFRRGESLSPLAFPDLLIAVDDILG